jgi:hypothetical protein
MESHLENQVEGRIRDAESDAALGQPGCHVRHLQAGHLAQLSVAQRREHHHLVQAVQKLRTELAADLRHSGAGLGTARRAVAEAYHASRESALKSCIEGSEQASGSREEEADQKGNLSPAKVGSKQPKRHSLQGLRASQNQPVSLRKP